MFDCMNAWKWLVKLADFHSTIIRKKAALTDEQKALLPLAVGEPDRLWHHDPGDDSYTAICLCHLERMASTWIRSGRTSWPRCRIWVPLILRIARCR